MSRLIFCLGQAGLVVFNDAAGAQSYSTVNVAAYRLYSIDFTISSITFFASPKTIMVLSM